MTDRPSEIDRIMVGNQIAIMRALASAPEGLLTYRVKESLRARVADVQGYWRSEFGQEVGFDASLGDRPK